MTNTGEFDTPESCVILPMQCFYKEMKKFIQIVTGMCSERTMDIMLPPMMHGDWSISLSLIVEVTTSQVSIFGEVR